MGLIPHSRRYPSGIAAALAKKSKKCSFPQKKGRELAPASVLPIMSFSDELAKDLQIIKQCRYHEAGHAVAFHWYGFQPTIIDAHSTCFDGRTAPVLCLLLKGKKVELRSSRVQGRAADFAVCLVAGIVAETRVSGEPMSKLKQISGEEDYRMLAIIAQSMLSHRPFEQSVEVHQALIKLWEQRAIALINQSCLWEAVDAVAQEMEHNDDRLDRRQLAAVMEGISASRSVTAA